MTGVERLRQSLKWNLMHEATRKIDFSCCGIHVSAQELQGVYWALNAYQLSIEIHPTQRQDLAYYDYKADAFLFQRADYGDSERIEKALMVHECVHAMIDILRLRYMRMSGSEAVAYVTQALFRKYAGADIRDDDIPILVAARDVATTVSESPGATVSLEDEMKLENVIKNDPEYIQRIALANNIRNYDGLNVLNAKGKGPR